jgi:Domain of unknown function (DUF4932)
MSRRKLCIVVAFGMAAAAFVGQGSIGFADRGSAAAGADTEGIRVAVDGRVELLSVLERLAGAPEYTRASTPYAAAVDSWFADHSGHEAVSMMRRLRVTNGISYDASMTLVPQIDDELNPVRPLSPLPHGVDLRWAGVDLESLLSEVRDFAFASRFDDFLATQAAYTTTVEERLTEMIAGRPIVDWFDASFADRPAAGYHVVPGLLTGDFSYGVHDGAAQIFAVVGLEAPDRQGLPSFGLLTEELLVHELAHSYVNPAVRARLDQISGPAPLLDAAQQAMEAQHYPTREIVVEESIVRALTVLYLSDEVSLPAALASVDRQVELGFVWTPQLVDAIDLARGAHDVAWTDEVLVTAAAGVLLADSD